MTIADLIDKFLYTHPTYSHTRDLLRDIKRIEEHYLQKLAELENDAHVKEFNKLIETGESTKPLPKEGEYTNDDYGKAKSCYCVAIRTPPCGYCESRHDDSGLITMSVKQPLKFRGAAYFNGVPWKVGNKKNEKS